MFQEDLLSLERQNPMTTRQKEGRMDLLPDDVIESIGQRLCGGLPSLDAFAQASVVCRQWRAILRDVCVRRVDTMGNEYDPPPSHLFRSPLQRALWTVRLDAVDLLVRHAHFSTCIVAPLTLWCNLHPPDTVWIPFHRSNTAADRVLFDDGGFWSFTHASRSDALRTIVMLLRVPSLLTCITKMVLSVPNARFPAQRTLFCVSADTTVKDALCAANTLGGLTGFAGRVVFRRGAEAFGIAVHANARLAARGKLLLFVITDAHLRRRERARARRTAAIIL